MSVIVFTKYPNLIFFYFFFLGGGGGGGRVGGWGWVLE